MSRILMALVCAFTMAASVQVAYSQQSSADSRMVTREKLRELLVRAAPLMETARNRYCSSVQCQESDKTVSFRQSQNNPFNFVGSMTGLANADSLEIVISVTKSDTIGFRVYPHYKGNYINLNRAKDANGLMRKLLYYSHLNFLFWGADDSYDIFSGYTVTLESGFPDEAIMIVLRSIVNTDKFVGAMKPLIDGEARSEP